MIEIDGSYHEGGGQILRSSLALSLLTSKPFRITGIRKGRKNPGLQPQHLAAVKLCQQLSDAKTEGAEIGSQELTFSPVKFESKDIEFDIGTAGSITLLLQSVMLPCMFGTGPTTLKIIGGTDVKWSQPYDYLENVLLPYLRKFAGIESTLIKRGYYPKGGGSISISITPKLRINEYQSYSELIESARKFFPEMNLVKQHELESIKGVSSSSSSLRNSNVAERIAESAGKKLAELGFTNAKIATEYSDSLSPGCSIVLWVSFNSKEWPMIIGADSLGERNKRSAIVGEEAAEKICSELKSCFIDEHLADQLLPFLVFLPKAAYKTSKITGHCMSNIYTIEKFLPVKYSVENNIIHLHP